MRRLLLAAVLASLAVTACGSDGKSSRRGGGDDDPDEPLRDLVLYPAPPYGTGVGDVLSERWYDGYHDPSVKMDQLEMVRFTELYNPTADAVWPEGTPRAGQPKPLFLVAVAAAGW